MSVHGVSEMEQMGLVSVVMPLYKEELSWVKQCVNSLVNQTYENIEIIVVNDDDQDSLNVKWVTSLQDSRIRVLQNDHNLGIVGSLNKVMDAARGAYIARMDADDVACEDRIEKQLLYLKNHAEVDFVMSGVSFIDGKGKLLSYEQKQLLDFQDVKRRIQYKSVGHHPTWLMHREAIELLNGYREVKHVEDLDFILRAISKNIHIHVMPELLLKYRLQSTSLTQQNQLAMYRGAVAVRKSYKNGEIFDSRPEMLSKRTLSVTQKQKDNFHYFVLARKQAINAMKQQKQIIPMIKYLLASFGSADKITWFARDCQYGFLKVMKLVK